jgi:hypothetical protein
VRQQNLDEDRQLALYQLGVQQMWPDRKGFELVWHYLSVPERRTSRRTDVDIDALVQSTMNLIREIQQAGVDDNFPTKETRLCNWCEYMSFCPAKVHPLSVEAKSGEDLARDEVVAAVDRYAEVKQHLASLQNEAEEIKWRLIRFARENELTALAGSEKNVSIRFRSLYRPRYAGLSEEKEKERRKFIDFLMKTGMIDKVFHYNPAGFDSFIRRAEYDAEHKQDLFDLLEVVDQKPSMTLRGKRG